ncbi:conserved Plasmodium protein, unknown function [Plasmodium chabaudi chabaudi]|uniref:Uncharacterized protein n=1 Tax=Plasmodium chabaudi chabaudi TaxID=31271 RepID=A0A4V6M957_PLACU|nr:conserved Plasmodium protein, unknown function [Plasmodium chabaudi chabaudi]VTZ68157.1 conserved Plasmodium protein, unknown function [Plasmodium chabaudi chabaudi]|eukprot:XP_016653677.1 conserved Plasmodium protein, unknown function [Plasmodium chabaudi chabaudi]
MYETKSSLRYSSKKSSSYEKELSSTSLQIKKNRNEIIKNKVYCPIELKNVYKLLEDSDQLLKNKDLSLEELIEHNNKIAEFTELCENFKVNTNNQNKPELNKTYNSIEQNMQYLNKHIETAKKDSITLKKKLKKSTDPLFYSTLEQKYKQTCLDIESKKNEIKFLKDIIRKNERLLDSNKKKPNKVALEKEYKNLLGQQSNICSRLIQLQNGNKLYEENICKIDVQLEEIKKKMNELKIDRMNENDNPLEEFNNLSKDVLEKRIFTLNTKRDELKKEKNNVINNLTTILTKLKKQISNLESEKNNLLNEEKNNLDKYQILKRTINTKINKTENKIKIFKKKNIIEKREDNSESIKPEIIPQKGKPNNSNEKVSENETNFIENLLDQENNSYNANDNQMAFSKDEDSKEEKQENNNNTDTTSSFNKKNKYFIPDFEEEILLKLQEKVNEKLGNDESDIDINEIHPEEENSDGVYSNRGNANDVSSNGIDEILTEVDNVDVENKDQECNASDVLSKNSSMNDKAHNEYHDEEPNEVTPSLATSNNSDISKIDDEEIHQNIKEPEKEESTNMENEGNNISDESDAIMNSGSIKTPSYISNVEDVENNVDVEELEQNDQVEVSIDTPGENSADSEHHQGAHENASPHEETAEVVEADDTLKDKTSQECPQNDGHDL